MRSKITVLIFLSIVLFNKVQAQQTLTLQQAISEALRTNYQIQIAQNEAEIAVEGNYAGAAGMVPTLGVNVNDNQSITNLHQELSNGTNISKDGVRGNAFNANLALNYTLFDGMRMFATSKKLDEFEKLGMQRTKSLIQNTVGDVIQAYSNVLREQNNLSLVKLTLAVSDDRLKLIKVRLEAGLANNTDLYLAQLDLEARKQALLTQEQNINNAYIILNTLINFKADSTYSIDTVLTLSNNLNKKDLDIALAQNPEILMAATQENIALQVQKEFQAARYPTLRLNAQYGYAVTQSQAGFTLLNSTAGPTVGVSFGLPLYAAGITQHNINIAKLQYKNAQLYKDLATVNIKSVYEQTWLTYTTTLEQVRQDEETVKVAMLYLDLMQLRYKSGQSTVLDFRAAQNSFEETNVRYINHKYTLKLAETDLLRLTGQLVK
jgi:outer membrane protein